MTSNTMASNAATLMSKQHCKRILIATDAWAPQVNGVVKTLEATIGTLRQLGHEVTVIHPGLFRSFPLPSYPEIPVAWPSRHKTRALTDRFAPSHIHIATEGTIGWAMRRLCQNRHWAFSTAYHTCFPEYLRERLPVPIALSYAYMRHFHAASSAIMVATASIEDRLLSRGFRNIVRWGRGVDLECFNPHAAMPAEFATLPRPIFLSVGRVAQEKNLEAFLTLDLPGSKVVIGDGPACTRLQAEFPNVHFLGARAHADLPGYFAHADVFVFPSLTDTFGLVQIEALACGTPVAAFPVAGPIDVIGSSGAGSLHADLQHACMNALSISQTLCLQHASTHDWHSATNQFLSGLIEMTKSNRTRSTSLFVPPASILVAD